MVVSPLNLKWPGHGYQVVELEMDPMDGSREVGSIPEPAPGRDPGTETGVPKPSRSPGETSESDQKTKPTSYHNGPDQALLPLALDPANLKWRPFYLQRRIIFSFAAVFALVIIALQLLLAVSNHNDGLVSAYPDQHYLWKYGPTAILTLIAALWSRAEYQSKLVAPWLCLAEPRVLHPKRTILLDYLSDFQLRSVFKAIRNRDFVVAITSTVAIVIKALVVISTGLITLSWTKVHHASWPMTLQDRFVERNTNLLSGGTLPWYVMQGLLNRNLTYPNGMSRTYAMQSVDAPGLSDTAETRVTVDGLQSGLECTSAELVLRGAAPPDPDYGFFLMNLTISSPSCSVEHLSIHPSPRWTCGRAESCNTVFSRFKRIQCDGLKGDDGERILVVFGNLTYTVDESITLKDYTGRMRPHPYLAELHRSTQMLCVPTYSITKVDVVRNGTQTLSATPVPGAEHHTLDGVTAWDIMRGHDMAFWNSVSGHGNVNGKSVQVSQAGTETIVDVDGFMELAFPTQLVPDQPLDTLYDAAALQKLATDYYRQFSAILTKQSLMEPASIETQGSVVVWDDRLVIRSWAAHWMAGLSTVCMVLIAIAFFLVPKRGILPCSPTTLPGIASLVAHSPDLLDMLRFLGAADAKNLGRLLITSRFKSGAVLDPMTGHQHFAILREQQLQDRRSLSFPQVHSKHTHPSVLHPASRLILCLVLVGFIVALEMTLRKSDRDRGLGDVGEDAYIHYIWTAVPAVAFGALSMIFSTMDFQVRCLAPYTALKNTISARTFLTLDFMDKSIPHTILSEIRFVNIGALAATMAFLVASLFTTFSASLFQPLAIETTVPLTLRVNKSFSLGPSGDRGAQSIASLIFQSNFSFPTFTYGDLAFPHFVPDITLPPDSGINASTLTINALVPAVRSRLDCRVYDASQIRVTTNLTLNNTNLGDDQTLGDVASNLLGITIRGEECETFPERELERYNNVLVTSANMTYFGLGSETEPISFVQGCSDFLYTWGKLSYDATPIVQHIAAVGCNETIETLSVNTTFRGTSLKINPHTPPIPVDSTAYNNTISKLTSRVYFHLAALATATTSLDQFFGMLTTSRWAIPLPSLGDPSATDRIVDAIKLHHGMIQAQNLAAHLVPANTTNSTLLPPYIASNIQRVEATDDVPMYEGLARTPEGEGKRRVIQDRTSTRVLQALLGCTIVLMAVGWASMRKTDVLPRSPTTIASVVALLGGGNLFELDLNTRTSHSESTTKGVGGDGMDGGGGGNGDKDGFMLSPSLAGGDGTGMIEGEMEKEKQGDSWVWGRGRATTIQIGEDVERSERDYREKILEELQGARFWMGWGIVPDWEGRVYGGGVNENGVSRFGIFAVRGGEEDGGPARGLSTGDMRKEVSIT